MAEVTIQLTGSGNWTVPEGVTQIKVWCVGAGGGSSGNASNTAGRGGGGGALGYFADYVSVPSGTSIPYQVGVGGSGATGYSANGSAGSFTRFGRSGDSWYIFGLGGAGGTYNGSNSAGGGANNTFGFVSVAGRANGDLSGTTSRHWGGAAGAATGYATGGTQTTVASPGLSPGGGGSSGANGQYTFGQKGADGALYVTYDDAPVTPPTPTYDATKFFLMF